jgi:predicted DNA-binding ribbon-helix-helix protein
MKSLIVKRSMVIDGHKTSVSLEDGFWECLREIAHGRGNSISHLVTSIDVNRETKNLSSAIRVFILDFYKGQSGQPSQAFQQRELEAPTEAVR